jgi:hypothetical protein
MRPLLAGVLVLALLGACSQAAPITPTEVVATIESVPTSASTLTPRFNATAAVGGGVNASGAVTDEQLKTVFAAVQQAAQMKISANSSPPGATGAAVTSVSITAEDSGGVLKSMDPAARKALGEALLTAAATAWPQAIVTLLVTDPASSSQIIGTRPKGGPNMVIGS